MGILGGPGYGKVKAALGCFDERRLLLEPSWAESVLRGFGAPPGELRAEEFKRRDSLEESQARDSKGARLMGWRSSAGRAPDL